MKAYGIRRPNGELVSYMTMPRTRDGRAELKHKMEASFAWSVDFKKYRVVPIIIKEENR